MLLSEEIQNNWVTDLIGEVQNIDSLITTEYPAWTVRFEDSYGVAIPIDDRIIINESFAEARIKTMIIRPKFSKPRYAIVLLSTSPNNAIPFSSLCESLVSPGVNGINRKNITADPHEWWKMWKELLGNRNIDERIYDVLGELCVLLYAIQHDEDAEWNGPNGASYDIETSSRFIEAKASINRTRREITISNQFQLYPPNKPLDLIFCRFEPVILNGTSIDSILNDFQAIGYNVEDLNRKLELRGFEKGMSSRKKTFILQEMLLYEVDDSFPRITPESFIGGVMPEGILGISYTVDLAGLSPKSLINGEKNGLQND